MEIVLKKKRLTFSLKITSAGRNFTDKNKNAGKKLISLAGKKYKISIGIEDPMTGKLAVRLSMKGTYNEGKLSFINEGNFNNEGKNYLLANNIEE